MEKLNQDLLEFLKLLESNDVEYLIIGGYAVTFHGYPRYTGDLGILVGIGEHNAEKLLHVFDEFGFGGIGIEKEDFLKESFVVEIGREPFKIQVQTSLENVHFKQSFKTRKQISYENTLLNVMSYDDLISYKKASGREKDLNDIQELQRIKKETVHE